MIIYQQYVYPWRILCGTKYLVFMSVRHFWLLKEELIFRCLSQSQTFGTSARKRVEALLLSATRSQPAVPLQNY